MEEQSDPQDSAEIIAREHVFTDVPPGPRDDVLRSVCDRLAEAGAFSADDAQTVYRGILKRERMGSTGIGRGIAIPHCRTSVVERPVAAFAKPVEPVEFGATDGAPVHSLFMVVSPLEDKKRHVAILKWIATVARSEYHANVLRTTTDPDSLYDLFLETRAGLS